MLVARVEKLLMASKWLWVVPRIISLGGYQLKAGQVKVIAKTRTLRQAQEAVS